MALRIALGATPGRILTGVVGRTTLVALVGIAIGAPLAVLAMRAMGSFLYEVSAFDPGLLGLAAASRLSRQSPASRPPGGPCGSIRPRRFGKSDVTDELPSAARG
jgi:ABC-type antimicrobial peptide transport system permease subunit